MKKTRKNDRTSKENAVELTHNRNNQFEFAQEHNILPVQLYKWRKELKEFGSGSFPENRKLKQTSEKEGLFELEKKRVEGVDPFVARGIVDVADAFHFVGSIGIFF